VASWLLARIAVQEHPIDVSEGRAGSAETEAGGVRQLPMRGVVADPGARRVSLKPALWLGAAAMLLFLLVPLVSLVWRTAQRSSGIPDSTRTILWQALKLSAITSVISLGIVIGLGTPLAYLLARKRLPLGSLIDTVIDLPMVLPPAVAGIALLMAFGRRGLIGQPLSEHGVTLGFTTAAVVIAQIFVSVPFYVRAARAGFGRVERALEEAAADLGAPPERVFLSVTLPLARANLMAGAVLAWARALGEFGATIMFAGNIAGRTQTMPLAIYGRYEAGDLTTALVLAVILLVAAMLVLLAVRSVGGRRGDLA
jgi:molybdate transport system permease protein